jgi:hypothetical protein
MGDESGASSAFTHKGVPTRLKYTKVLKTNNTDTGSKKVLQKMNNSLLYCNN